MKILIVSDTHSLRCAMPYIRYLGDRYGIVMIIHCGDVDPDHILEMEYQNIYLFCALIERKPTAENFVNPPDKVIYTYPDNRIIDLGNYGFPKLLIYLGHARSFDFLFGNQRKLIEILQNIWNLHHGVRYLFSGHTHHQTYAQGRRISFINPGAVTHSFDGYEYALLDTDKDEVIFSRIFPIEINKKITLLNQLNIGIISDSVNITSEERDPDYWSKLADVFKREEVTSIVHCGNIDTKDIGRKELSDFQVYAKVFPQQDIKSSDAPENWTLLYEEKPIIKIDRYTFQVDYYLGKDIMDKSEEDLLYMELERRKDNLNINYVLFGFTNDGFYEEGQHLRYLNPGDSTIDRDYVIIRLPRNEICFGHVPM